MQKIKHYIFIVLVILITMFSVIIFKNQKYTENKLNNNIQNIIKNKDLTLGLAVKKDDKILFEINGNQEFPLLSVFKFHITLAVLDYIDKNNIPLDQTIKISKDFIKTNTYSPLRETYGVVDLELTLQELIEYTMIYSDNNTCDILIDFVGGVDKVNNYIKSLGIKNCNITLNEYEMHKDFKNQYLNTSTPIEVVNLLDIFYHKDLFSNKYKEFLINTMIATETGNKKIRYLLPKNIKVGDKTGSSDRLKNNIKIADNDSGFIVLPNGEVYFLSIFIYNSKESDKENARIIAEISKEIYNFIAQN